MNRHQIRTTWGQCLVDPLPIDGTTWLEKSAQAVMKDPNNNNAEYFLAMQEVLDEKDLGNPR